ncbi:unnamed protein product [Caenorhabditis brenneri]
MGNSQSSDDEEAIRDAQRQEEARRQREFEAEQAAQNRYQQEREDQRRDARLREEAAEKRQMEREKELREERRREQEAAERRREAAEREQYERKVQAENRADERFREQRDFNQAEIKEKASEYKEALTKKEKEKADTETKFEERAVKLEKERKEEQDKYYQDKKEFDVKISESSRHHHTEIENQLQRNHEIEAQMNKDAHDHEQRLAAGNTIFKQCQARQIAAGECDSVENHFIDSVNNTRNSGKDVVNAVRSLKDYASSLREGVKAPKGTIDMLKLAIQRTQLKLRTLSDSVDSILGQTENKNKGVVKCQEIARDIEETANNLIDSISEFKGSLEEKPIKNSPTLFKEVSKYSMELSKLLTSFPTLSRSNYTIGVILENVKSIPGSSGVAHLESLGSRPAIEDLSSN